LYGKKNTKKRSVATLCTKIIDTHSRAVKVIGANKSNKVITTIVNKGTLGWRKNHPNSINSIKIIHFCNLLTIWPHNQTVSLLTNTHIAPMMVVRVQNNAESRSVLNTN